MNPEIKQAAEQLVAATKRGDMAQAYGIASRVRYQDLQAVALEAGFSCVCQRDKRAFMTHLQHQIAEASRRRTDGYGLRQGAD